MCALLCIWCTWIDVAGVKAPLTFICIFAPPLLPHSSALALVNYLVSRFLNNVRRHWSFFNYLFRCICLEPLLMVFMSTLGGGGDVEISLLVIVITVVKTIWLLPLWHQCCYCLAVSVFFLVWLLFWFLICGYVGLFSRLEFIFSWRAIASSTSLSFSPFSLFLNVKVLFGKVYLVWSLKGGNGWIWGRVYSPTYEWKCPSPFPSSPPPPGVVAVHVCCVDLCSTLSWFYCLRLNDYI